MLSENDRFECPNIRVSTKVDTLILTPWNFYHAELKGSSGNKAKRVDTLAVSVILEMRKSGQAMKH